MKVITESSDFRLPATVVSIGMFDGVHRGHTKVLRQLRARGEQRNMPTAVVTFDPHPRAVVRPDARPMLLSSLEDRMQLLAATDAVDHCLVLRFDRAKSEQPAEEFVRNTLVFQLGMRELIVGENFACGRGRQGTVSYLAALGRQLGFVVAPVGLDALPQSHYLVHSSSTEARRLIQLGDMAAAAAVLQRPHEMTATITRAEPAMRRVVEAELPTAMCVPAAADYVGAVRCSGTDSLWIPALLQVRGNLLSDRHLVRLVAKNDMQADPGELLRMRFIDRAPGPHAR
jgi:riboflavin kinase/FMN adenylyltransferase